MTFCKTIFFKKGPKLLYLRDKHNIIYNNLVMSKEILYAKSLNSFARKKYNKYIIFMFLTFKIAFSLKIFTKNINSSISLILTIINL